MTSDRTIDALLKAVESSPDDVELRLHIVAQLREAGRAVEALEHCSVILAANPAHPDALAAAAASAKEAGDNQKAVAYSRLAQALGEVTQDAAPIPTRAGARPELTVVGGTAKPAQPVPDEPATITLEDVAGLVDVKKRLELAFLGPIRNPELAKAYGKKMRGGLMLYGPPGCGKTYIARALAGELRATFISIAINDILDMWLGESEKRLHAVFEAARESAPSVVFIDELDAIGHKRGSLGTSAARDVVNQLLAELDGMSTGDEALFVLGATNLPWDVDTALKRPGRFDRSIFVPPPDEEARRHILEMNFAGRPAENLRFDVAVRKTSGFSGADVAHICETATELALARAMESGSMAPISTKDVEAAMREIRPSTAKWFQTAKNYAMFGNSSGEFNDLAEYITKNRL